MSPKQVQSPAAVFLLALVAIVTLARDFNNNQSNSGRVMNFTNRQPQKGASDDANNCAVCHQKIGDQAVSLYSKSTHAKNDFSCDTCHGGDPKATDKAAAHRLTLAGKPDDGEKLALCGSCHTTQLATFKTSLHAPARASAPRMTCVECHGAHTVGSLSRDFSFALYCTNCHGLEYLPALPPEFQRMLALVDEEKDLLKKLESMGRKPSPELLSLRKEIRRGVAEIVHATNLSGGLERLPQVFNRGAEFKAMAAREQR